MTTYLADASHDLVRGRAWSGGLSATQRVEQVRFAEGVQGSLRAAIDIHSADEKWLARGADLRQVLVDMNPFFGALWLAYIEVDGLRGRAGDTYRHMLNALTGCSSPAIVEGELVDIEYHPETVERLLPVRPSAQALAAEVLGELGEPDDEWRRYLVLGLLIEPRLAAWALPLAPSLVPRGVDAPPWRRDLRLPDRTPHSVGRGGLQMHSALQVEHGVDGKAVRPRRPGSYRPSDARRRFDEYVVKRRNAKVSVQLIATDAEALRLYRAWKPDADILTERVVRSAIARAERSTD